MAAVVNPAVPLPGVLAVGAVASGYGMVEVHWAIAVEAGIWQQMQQNMIFYGIRGAAP